MKLFTAKIMFLLSLAIGSRVSELCALRRGNFVKFLPGGDLKLIPDPSVLAKNENPMIRRQPLRISGIPGADNILCPVNNLRRYLAKSANCETTSLFVHPTGKSWTPAGTRRVLCSLIKEANPESCPKSHDIRKMASSLAFFSSMTFQNMQAFTGWSSSKVFLRHYLKPIENLQRTSVVLGRNVTAGRSRR